MKAWRSVLAILVFIASGAAGAADLLPDRDFRLVNPPMMVDAKNKIEVTEFFWYGCPHCFDFEPLLGAWVKKLPKDVSFRRIPTIFPNNKWQPGARLFYTLEAMGLTEKFHAKVFNAIHMDRVRLDDEKTLLEWMTKEGVDAKKFAETWNSFAVMGRVQQSKQLTAASGITGVPAVIVQGRYAALTPGNYEDLLKLLDQLIDRARAESAQPGVGKK